MTEEEVSKIVEWSLGDNTYKKEEILSLPQNYLVIEIAKNKVKVVKQQLLPNGEMEQRQFSMLKMVEIICSKYEIPDIIFGYCGNDRTPDINGPFFTHSRLRGQKTRNILAPCFTFYGYPERDPNVIKNYYESWKELLENRIEWESKKNSCMFIGTVSEHNNRLGNTSMSFNEQLSLEIINQAADSKNFITRDFLSNYKFLLHLNGNDGAYASRFKYLLGTGSLVFYNYNSGNEINFWEEWWMHEDIFQDGVHYISAENVTACQEKIIKHFNDPKKSSKIASNGFSFFKEYLSPESVEKFWVKLLIEYSKKLI